MWQDLRELWGIAFTGKEPTAGQLPCPSDAQRGRGGAHAWGGNRPTEVDPGPPAPHPRPGFGPTGKEPQRSFPVHIRPRANPVRDAIRRFLGLDLLEAAVTSIKDELTGLKGEFADFVADVNAKVAQLEAAQGSFDPEAQSVFDDLKASVEAAHASVGDADGSDTPAPSPVEPTPDAPVDPETPTDQ
jgi:hypothetical protein